VQQKSADLLKGPLSVILGQPLGIIRTGRINKYKYTAQPELADATTYAPGRRYECTHQMAAVFYVK